METPPAVTQLLVLALLLQESHYHYLQVKEKVSSKSQLNEQGEIKRDVLRSDVCAR